MKKKVAYMVATPHLDTVWRWKLADTVEKFIPDTLIKNFDLLEKYPNYKLNFEGAYRYELIEEYYPKAFEKIKEYVKQGRWNPCAAEYENGDVITPSPEAITRNILLGNNYFYDKFKVKSKDIFLPDCFGFGAALPQIISDAGLIGFTTQKLTWGCANGIPFDLGLWVAPNGSEISASFNPGSYRYKLTGDVRADLGIINGITKTMRETNGALPVVNHLFGTGDCGGAPTEESVKSVNDSESENADIPDFEVKCAFSEDIHKSIISYSKTPDGSKLPRYKGDLLMTSHGAGTYTSRTQSKRLDCQCEQAAHAAEFMCAFASLFGTYNYPKENLNLAWKRSIKHQFHDDITGTSVMAVYNDSWDDYYASLAQFKGEYTGALNSLARNMDTSSFNKNCAAVAVANPTQFRRRESVKAKVKIKSNAPYVKVYDKGKKEVESQIISKNGKEFEIIFKADVPSYGVHIYSVAASNEPCSIKADVLNVTEHTLENKKYKIIFNKNGDLAYLYDKENSRQVLSKPIKLALLRDIGSLAYPSWEIDKNDLDKEPYCFANTPEFEIYENGAARVALKITREAEYSTVTQIISLDEDSEFVRVDNYIDWRTRRSMMKAVFPLNARNHIARYDTGIGYAERYTNTEKLYEVPAQNWADITDTDGEYGVSILSDSRHGWDKPDESTLRLTCIHTPAGAFINEARQDLQDIGRNCFSFGIYSHSGSSDNKTGKQASLFCKKLIPSQVELTQKVENGFSQVASLMKMSHDNVIIKAVKISENDKNAVIVRLCNVTNDVQKNATLSFYREFEKAQLVNTSEEYIEGCKNASNKTIRLTFKPFEVITLKISFAECSEKRNLMSFSPIKLEYNANGITPEDGMKHIILQGAGFSLPREMIKGNKITARGIDFEIPDSGGRYDITVCRGQKIKLGGKFKKLYLLAAAVGDSDIEEIFTLDNSQKTVKIKSMTEPFGKWDLYALSQKAKTDDTTLYGFEFTHLHHPEGKIVKKARFYLYTFNVVNKKTLILPENNRLIILAATGASEFEYDNPASSFIDIASDDYNFGEIPPIDKITDKTQALTIRAGKIQDQINTGKGKGFKRDNIFTNIVRSYTKSEW